MKVFHQAGHNTIWNLDSFTDEDTGDGIIFSPVHYESPKLEAVGQEIRRASLFDPQFYVPDSQKSKLQSYDFFPETIMDGFSTDNFEVIAYEAARLCVEFQIANEFDELIIPARYFPEMISDYIERQRVFTVDPFLNACGQPGTDKTLILTLPLTSAMLIDVEYRTNILNWVTAYTEIDGIYLLVDFNETSKQLQDFDKFQAYTAFINDLQEAEHDVICGYCNTEGLLLTALDVSGVCMGAYENTRRFSIDKFLEDDLERRGPAARIFFPNLLNWVRWDTAVEIREDFPDLWDAIYSPTDYSERVFAAGQPPHFTQPALYKHHFLLLTDMYDEMRELPVAERGAALQGKIRVAGELYRQIEARGVMFFDANCMGEHLPVWNRVLRRLPN